MISVLPLLLVASLTTASRYPLKIAEDLTVTDAQFGRFESAGVEFSFTATTAIPHVVGTMYGWCLRVTGTRAAVTVQETLTLPVAPKTWGGSNETAIVKISADGRTATTTLDLKVVNGRVVKVPWVIAAGDPQGAHSLELRIDGKRVAEFHFAIQAEK